MANVYDSVQTLRSAGFVNQQPAIILLVFRLPGANVIQVVDRIKATLPSVRASIPAGDNLNVLIDLTTTIRASVHDVERTLIISIILVIAVVFAFLRSPRGTLIPGVAVTVSLIGTFGVMYLVGYSVDNLSLMALTISTGFVVDDAIVVMENITRLIELGMPVMEASLQGAQEVGFTVLSMSLSLIAVFVPILFMGGIVGRIFHEFAFVLTTSIAVSMLISLTVTPMMCSQLLKPIGAEVHNRIYRASEHAFELVLAGYRRTLIWSLEHPVLIIVTLFATLALNVVLIGRVPKGFFPLQDTGGIQGGLQGAQDASFQSMRDSVLDVEKVIMADPAVDNVIGFTGGQGGPGGGAINNGFTFVSSEAARRTRHQCRRCGRSPAAQTGEADGRLHLPAGVAGSLGWRTAEQCRVPVPALRRHGGGPHHLGPAALRRNAQDPAAEGRDHRPAEPRLADDAELRPPFGGALRDHSAAD